MMSILDPSSAGVGSSPIAVRSVTEIMLQDSAYARVPDEEKAHVAAKLGAMLRIDGAKNKAAAFLAESKRTHAGRTLSEGAIRKLYYDKWLDGGRKWSALINRARVPLDTSALPEETVRHWHALVYRYRGKHKAAHRELVRQWEKWFGGDKDSAIPGFEKADRAADLPAGLSYANLMRGKYRPTKFAQAAAAVGMTAAAVFAPGVLTTRHGLAFGSHYVFDDIWHDIKVNVPGQMGARRLLQFHCLELLSACQCARGMKPELLNDRTGKFERLKERELLFLLAHVLGSIGYNADGCELMMEHGTASVSGRVEAFLSDATGGKIRIGRGSISGSPLAPGLYAGRGKGNFKFKAALESLGNLVHNETADRLALPAQTGSNSRLNAPDELYGQEKHHDALVVAMLALPAPLRELVRLPATPLYQAIEFCDMVQERINERRDHDLEGWDRCNFTLSEFRLHPSQAWSPMTQLLEMPEILRGPVQLAIESDRRLSRARQLSPREVFDGLRPQLTTLRAHHVPQILGMEYAEERRVAKDGRFAFEDMDLGPGDHVYDGNCRDDEGHVRTLPAGEKFATFVSTIDPVRMYVCDAKGRYLGWCERTFTPTRGDAAGFARAAGRKMQAHRALLAPVLEAARPILKRQVADAQINDAIFAHAQGAHAPAMPAAEQRTRQKRRAVVDQEIAEAARSNVQAEPASGSLYNDASDS